MENSNSHSRIKARVRLYKNKKSNPENNIFRKAQKERNNIKKKLIIPESIKANKKAKIKMIKMIAK